MAAISRPYIRERVNMGTVRETRTGMTNRTIDIRIGSLGEKSQRRWCLACPARGSVHIREFRSEYGHGEGDEDGDDEQDDRYQDRQFRGEEPAAMVSGMSGPRQRTHPRIPSAW